MAARAKWMQELHCRTTSESEWLGGSTSCLKDNSNTTSEDFVPVSYAHCDDILLGLSEPIMSSNTSPFETEKHPVESSELQFIDKSVIEEKPIVKTEDKNSIVGLSSKILDANYEDDDDDWPEEDYELHGHGGTIIHVVNEEDISFSDLEDDDFHAPTTRKTVSKD